jgi:UDP-3-O-[3-hydroxymyristoyl] glucosamine N-acyltransferase
MEVVNGLKASEQEYGIHDTAVIHPEAEIHEQVYIGPFTYVGKAKIERGTRIHGHVYIYDQVQIGRNVSIEAGCILGADGYGYQKNHEGDWERFPHLGGLVIEDDVEISCNATIDRGSLGDTIVGRNTKISKATHLSHNVITGERCIIAGGAMVSGSVTLGDNVWIGPNATILQKLTIDKNVTVSLGAVVSKNISTGYTAVGNRIIPEQTKK